MPTASHKDRAESVESFAEESEPSLILPHCK
jgi:hypothetical protein